MKKLLFPILLMSCIGTLLSCEKEVNFNLPTDVANKLVVEGSIEVGEHPIIYLSNSFGFNQNFNQELYSTLFAHGAIITVSEGNRSIQLIEDSIEVEDTKFYFYTINQNDPLSQDFIGEFGKTYSLRIDYNKKTYESVTTIPYINPIDSIWSDTLKDDIEGKPELRELFIKFTDPDSLGNAYKEYTKVNSNPFMTAKYTVSNDAIFNGVEVKTSISNGYDKVDTTDSDSRAYFKVGDTVVLKWCAIDQNVFKFWRTLEFATGTVGNPFSTPIKATSNISNEALGVWAGYGTTFDTLIIKD